MSLWLLGVAALLGLLIVWSWQTKRGGTTGANVMRNGVGADDVNVHGQPMQVSHHLPTAIRAPVWNTTDVLVDPRVQEQWAQYEQAHQVNAGQPNPDGLPQNGEFWPHGWTPLGPIAPLVHRGADRVARGPQDPQLAYAMSITGALDGQERKFATPPPDPVVQQYLGQLQQVEGSHFQVDAASDDAYETPQVVDRFAFLPQQAAQYVVAELNKAMRETHPCFSLAGREHFELSNPPMQCGDTSNVKQSPITLIRVFESRLKKRQDGTQELFLTMEIGNMISAGSGGMFSTVVFISNKGSFCGFNPLTRDLKHTFVLPRTR